MHLQKVKIDSEGFTTVELEDLAGSSPLPSDLDGVLRDAQEIRREIQQIHDDVSDLRSVNFQTLNKTGHGEAPERDSNAIGADIKRRGESVLRRLHALDALRGDLEAGRGGADPAARIARTQYQCLSQALQEAMHGYNQAEMSHKDACRNHIRRQLEVAGRDLDQEELEEALERQEWTVFGLQAQGGTTRSALESIESRHRELRDLEKRVQQVQELFLDVALLTEEQGAGVQSIQRNVQDTHAAALEGIFKLERATTSDKNNPFKKLFCGCFPCYNSG